jgi:hypothetical protein
LPSGASVVASLLMVLILAAGVDGCLDSEQVDCRGCEGIGDQLSLAHVFD